MVTEVVYATDCAVMMKLAVVLPAATVTEAGTVAEGLLLESATEMPPVGAALLNVTVPVDEVPLTTVVGFTETEERATAAAGVIERAAVLLTLL